MEVSIGFRSHQGTSSHPGSRLSRALGGLALLAEAVPSREGLSKSLLEQWLGWAGKLGFPIHWGLPGYSNGWDKFDAWKIAEN